MTKPMATFSASSLNPSMQPPEYVLDAIGKGMDEGTRLQHEIAMKIVRGEAVTPPGFS